MRMLSALDSLRSGLEFGFIALRGEVACCWRRLRGRHGVFTQGEASAPAARLTDLWARSWPDAEPIGYALRIEYFDRWVRFHSLPESKRYAENATEYEEILRRHRTVLYELLGSADSRAVHGLYVIGEDWSWRDLAAGWTKRHLPGAWPWRISAPDGDSDAHAYFWVASDLTEQEVDALLLGAADDRCHIVIGAHDLTWLYHPYDGGADVLLPSTAERDALRERHAEWLSKYPGGT